MKLQFPLIVGLLAGSLIALPVEANNGYRGDSFVIAKRGADEGGRNDERRDNRRVRRPSDERSYGYGYERRQREPEASPPQGQSGDDRRDERRKKGERR